MPLALPQISPYLEGMTLVGEVNVADVASERTAAYTWRLDAPSGSFPSEYYAFETIGCAGQCRAMEGGRRINGAESFSVPVTPGQDVLLVTRLHPMAYGRIQVSVNGVPVDERIVPDLPGAWLEVPTLIPAFLVTDEMLTITIRPIDGGMYYAPYRHWVYQGDAAPVTSSGEPFATAQNGALRIEDVGMARLDGLLTVNVTWGTGGSLPVGDYKVFIHVLDESGAIAAQADARPGQGALPPGNWLAGMFSETFTIDTGALARGEYRVTMGLYNPQTNERLTLTGADEFSRLLIGSFTVN
jgi:hypothetical protein